MEDRFVLFEDGMDQTWRAVLDITAKETSQLTPPTSFIRLLESLCVDEPEPPVDLVDIEIDELNARLDSMRARSHEAGRSHLTIGLSADVLWAIDNIQLVWASLIPFSGSGVSYSPVVVLMAAVTFWASGLALREQVVEDLGALARLSSKDNSCWQCSTVAPLS
jgi:hypothetical protein